MYTIYEGNESGVSYTKYTYGKLDTEKIKKNGTHEIIIVIVLKVEQFGLMMQ